MKDKDLIYCINYILVGDTPTKILYLIKLYKDDENFLPLLLFLLFCKNAISFRL